MISLSDLPAAFAAARAEASAAAPVVEDTPPNTCRYCGRFWRPFPQVTSDGHAKCLVPVAFQRAVYELWWYSPEVNEQQIASTCGIGVDSVRRWLRNVERQGRAA